MVTSLLSMGNTHHNIRTIVALSHHTTNHSNTELLLLNMADMAVRRAMASQVQVVLNNNMEVIKVMEICLNHTMALLIILTQEVFMEVVVMGLLRSRVDSTVDKAAKVDIGKRGIKLVTYRRRAVSR